MIILLLKKVYLSDLYLKYINIDFSRPTIKIGYFKEFKFCLSIYKKFLIFKYSFLLKLIFL